MMTLQPKAFNAWLAHIGQQVKWQASYACPCSNPVSGASKPQCPLCNGRGIQWASPVDCVIGVASQKVQRNWAQFGNFESGDAVCVLPEDSSCFEMGKFDRVLMMNSKDKFSLVLTHGAPDEFVNYQVADVTRVFWLNPAGDTVIEGGIPTVASNGALTWASGAPPSATQYTITGDKFSEYFCFGPYPSDRNEHSGARLPKNVVLRLFDLFNR
jgi:hypothetical protein